MLLRITSILIASSLALWAAEGGRNALDSALFERLGGCFVLGDATTLTRHGAGWRVAAADGSIVEAAEAVGDGGTQSIVEAEGGHAASGLLKVHTTAGGTLRQMRLPCVPSSCRRSRKARGTGGVGP